MRDAAPEITAILGVALNRATAPLRQRGSFWFILLAGPPLFSAFAFFQANLLGIAKPLPSYAIPGAIGLLTSLLVAALWSRLLLKKEKEKIFFLELVEVLAIALDERDQYTHGHARRVTTIALQLGAAMKLTFADMEVLRLSGILHDIGKIGIPDQVLLKPGKLSGEEFAWIRKHPEKGARILRQLHNKMIAEIADIIKHHHERYDGKGYPAGLHGEEIPLLSRIIALADSYDAMTSDRPYRKGMTREDALAEMRKGSGGQFDPVLVANFLDLYEIDVACDFFQGCEVFALIQHGEMAKAYEVQYCRGNYLACARRKIRNKTKRPGNLLPDGSLYGAATSADSWPRITP